MRAMPELRSLPDRPPRRSRSCHTLRQWRPERVGQTGPPRPGSGGALPARCQIGLCDRRVRLDCDRFNLIRTFYFELRSRRQCSIDRGVQWPTAGVGLIAQRLTIWALPSAHYGASPPPYFGQQIGLCEKALRSGPYGGSRQESILVDQGRGLREQVLRFLGPVVQNLGRPSRNRGSRGGTIKSPLIDG